MISKSKHYDEVRVDIGDDDFAFLYIDYDEGGYHVKWSCTNPVQEMEVAIVLCRLLGPKVTASSRVKVLALEMMFTAELEKRKARPGIVPPPPF